MRRRGRWSRAAALVASAFLIATVAPLGGDASGQPARLEADSVSVTVDDVTPSAPVPSSGHRAFQVTLTLANRTDRDIRDVRVEGERGEPINSQAGLDSALARVSPPAGVVVPITPTRPVEVDLPAGEERQLVFRTSSSIQDDGGLCICAANAVYPLYFSAHVQDSGQVDQQLGVTGTFVPSFYAAPTPVRVSWIWPLIDQPHRLENTGAGGTEPVFTDDLLAGSVGPGGRLDRALSVVEAVGGEVPLTLVIDPELLDELQIMASGPYRVQVAKTRTSPGTGHDAAASWLTRLRTVLAADPLLQVQLTPYADPDVEALSHEGLGWSSTLPSDMQGNVALALGGHLTESTLAWPAGGALSRGTLDQLVDDGVGTVLLNSSAVGPKPAAGAVRPGLARLSARGRDIGVGLLTPALQKYVSRAISVGSPGTALLPQLLAELAVRAAQEPEAGHVAVLAAPRYVDASVETAARVITETSRSTFARPISLSAAVGGALLPNGRSRLAAVPDSARTLPQLNLDAAKQVSFDLPTLRSLFRGSTPAALTLLGRLPIQAQLASSTAWGRSGGSAAGAPRARTLITQLDQLTHGVRIVKPSSGSYTLASDNSPLPITVENNLDFAVSVMVQVSTINGLPGFTATPKRQSVEAHSKATLHLATNIDRTGRIPVRAELLTPNGKFRLGDQTMTVRSTALGVVGVIITVGAGAVLLLALLIRFGRRLGRRKRKGRPPRRHWDPDSPGAEDEFEATMHPESAERSP